MKKVLTMLLVLLCTVCQLIFAQTGTYKFAAKDIIPTRTISGLVTCRMTGETLIGACVVVTGTTKGTITDVDGKYTLDVPVDAESLTFYSLGYVSLRIALGSSNIVNAALKEDSLTPPTITILEPDVDDRGLGVEELLEVKTKLRGSVTDGNGIQNFQINGKTIVLKEDGEFTVTVKLAEGDNIYVLRATDTRGNRTEKTLTLHHAPPPVIEPMKPKQIIATPEKRLALLIGNSQYQQVASLSNPANDVRAIEQKLKTLGFEVMSAVNLNKKQMQDQIRAFSRRLKDFEVGLLFYAGHGVEVEGINYLLPTDMPKPKDIIKADMPDVAIKTSYVEKAMSDAGNENKTYLLILDACRNDPFRAWRDLPDESPNWTPPKTVPSGFLTIYAASQGERAGDGSGQNGTFTSALLQHLATPCISIQSMLIRVRTELKQYKGVQEPEERSKLNKEFFFKACKN